MNSPLISRRRFLEWSLRAAGGAAGAAATAGLLNSLAASVAHAQTGDYRALVCVFLLGGNDSFNLLVPTDSGDYDSYAKSRGGLAIPRSELLDIQPGNTGGRGYGLHPVTGGLRDLFTQGRLSFAANSGVLLAPTTRADYQAGRALPPQLFSHNDQQDHWMSGEPGGPKFTGWGGRMADLLMSRNANQRLSMNISLTGTNLFQVGDTVLPLSVESNGARPFTALTGQSERRRVLRSLIEQSAAEDRPLLESAYGSVVTSALDNGAAIQQALAAAPALATRFPEGSLGVRLRMIARLISVRERLGLSRQIFFVSLAGFDTHDDQQLNQPPLLKLVADSLKSFHDATVELGVANQVTAFTASDFGRTLTSNGDGTDHGWGGNQMVVGGAVRGGNLIGTYPDLRLDGPDDAGLGRMVPTTAVDQLGATFGRWMGIADSDLDTVFPNLKRFAQRDLGFLA